MPAANDKNIENQIGLSKKKENLFPHMSRTNLASGPAEPLISSDVIQLWVSPSLLSFPYAVAPFSGSLFPHGAKMAARNSRLTSAPLSN